MDIKIETEELHGVKATDFSSGCCDMSFYFQGSELSMSLDIKELKMIKAEVDIAIKRLTK